MTSFSALSVHWSSERMQVQWLGQKFNGTRPLPEDVKPSLQHWVTMMRQKSLQSLTRICFTDPLRPLVSRVSATVPKRLGRRIFFVPGLNCLVEGVVVHGGKL